MGQQKRDKRPGQRKGNKHKPPTTPQPQAAIVGVKAPAQIESNIEAAKANRTAGGEYEQQTATQSQVAALDRYAWGNFIFTAVLTISTVIATCIGGCQWWIMRGDLQQTQKTVELMQRQLGASVGLDDGPTAVMVPDVPMGIIVPVKNFGNSFAIDVSGDAVAFVKPAKGKLDSYVDIALRDTWDRRETHILPPGVRIREAARGPALTKTQIDDINKGDYEFYILTSTYYSDGIGNRVSIKQLFRWDPGVKGFFGDSTHNYMRIYKDPKAQSQQESG